MQYHLNGFRPGDPNRYPRAETQTDDIDVLIVGSGPAGLALAAYLAHFAEIKTVLIEQKNGPMEKGQADGVSCRSMEMFQVYGFADQVMREAYWVNEATFWKPDPQNPQHIIRSGRVQDVEDGLSEMPHVILNQARVHDMFLSVMRNAPTRMEPLYGRQVTSLDADETGVTVELEEDGKASKLCARYVVGCDGARSNVRKQIGLELDGDSAHQAWGVMDILCTTDFPDIRFKSLIQSASEGTVLVIPREGGYLVRLYVEMDKLRPDERVAHKDIQVESLIAAANRIFSPYTINVADVVWWSVYEIGQRLTQRFDNRSEDILPNVFIAGDACHTHSPKAGQGMNVSMGDAFNLGWKLAHVLTNRASTDLLLSYSDERQDVAQTLIDFDEEWARIMSARPQETSGEDPQFQKYFIEHGRYTAGVTVRYKPSNLTTDDTWQHLAPGFPIGMRFHSAPVVRLADGKPMHLGHVQQTDARWLLLVFAGGDTSSDQLGQLNHFCPSIAKTLSDLTPDNLAPDGVIDLRAVVQTHHQNLNITDFPELLFPPKGNLGLRDYEKAFCPDPSQPDVFDMRNIDRADGCVVLVRPDQYVAGIWPVDEVDALTAFLQTVLRAS